MLAAAMTAVGLVGTVALPTPAQADSAGSLEFLGSMTTPPLGLPLLSWPNSGTITFVSHTCLDSAVTTATLVPATAGLCSIWGAGDYGPLGAAHCGLASGTIDGGFSLSNGHYYTFSMNYDLVGAVVNGSGTSTSTVTGEWGTFAFNAVITAPGFTTDYNCLNMTLTHYQMVGSAQFQTR